MNGGPKSIENTAEKWYSDYTIKSILKGEIMTIRDVMNTLEAKCIIGEENLDKVVETCCGSDMMSDVLAFTKNNGVLLSGLCNPQVIRTAEMMDIVCVVMVRGKHATDEMVEMAGEGGIVLLETEHRMFTSCGMLYANGLSGGDL